MGLANLPFREISTFTNLCEASYSCLSNMGQVRLHEWHRIVTASDMKSHLAHRNTLRVLNSCNIEEVCYIFPIHIVPSSCVAKHHIRDSSLSHCAQRHFSQHPLIMPLEEVPDQLEKLSLTPLNTSSSSGNQLCIITGFMSSYSPRVLILFVLIK